MVFISPFRRWKALSEKEPGKPIASMKTYSAVLFASTLSSTGEEEVEEEDEEGREEGGGGRAWRVTVVGGRRTSLRTVKWMTGGREGGREGCECHEL